MSRYLYSAVRGFLPPVPTSVTMMPMTLFHTCSVLERARQSTRIRKRKYYMEMKKKKEERLRKNPPGIPYKVQLMLRAKGLGGKPRPWRQLDERPFPTDEVWGEMWHTWNRINVGEALDFLRYQYKYYVHSTLVLIRFTNYEMDHVPKNGAVHQIVQYERI